MSYKKNKDFYYDDHGITGYRPLGSQEKRSYVDRKGTARLFIAKGKVDNFDTHKLLDFLEKTTGISKRNIDDIKVMDSFSFFAVPYEEAEKVLKIFQQKSGGKKSLVSRAKAKK